MRSAGIAPPPPNKDTCPASRSRANWSVAFSTSGNCSISEARLRPSASSAPALTSASSARLLSLVESTRLQKSSRSAKSPPARRASTIASQAPRPTPFTAPRP